MKITTWIKALIGRAVSKRAGKKLANIIAECEKESKAKEGDN